MRAMFKAFSCVSEVAAFLTELGRDRIIAVHRDDRGISVGYMVWYWEQSE